MVVSMHRRRSKNALRIVISLRHLVKMPNTLATRRYITSDTINGVVFENVDTPGTKTATTM